VYYAHIWKQDRTVRPSSRTHRKRERGGSRVDDLKRDLALVRPEHNDLALGGEKRASHFASREGPSKGKGGRKEVFRTNRKLSLENIRQTLRIREEATLTSRGAFSSRLGAAIPIELKEQAGIEVVI